MPQDLAEAKGTTPPHITTFSSLPSRSAESGKLAPLDVGQRSPRSNAAPRLSLRSSSPREQCDHPPERASFSLHHSGSSSPRSLSPRLPPMTSAPSPSMKDDSSLPGLGPGLSPRKGAQSARRVRSLSPNIQRASITDRASLGSIRPQSRGGASGSGGGGSGGRMSPLLGAKERDSRRGDSDPTVNGGVSSSSSSSRRRREGGGGGELAVGPGGGAGEPPRLPGEIAEAKNDATVERSTRLPGTTSASPSSRRSSSSGGLPNSSISSSSTSERLERRNRLSREEPATPTRGLSPTNEQNHNDGRGDSHRQQHHHRETKDCGSTPSIPSIGRGEDSSRSPRTRRMRPQVDSTA